MLIIFSGNSIFHYDFLGKTKDRIVENYLNGFISNFKKKSFTNDRTGSEVQLVTKMSRRAQRGSIQEDQFYNFLFIKYCLD